MGVNLPGFFYGGSMNFYELYTRVEDEVQDIKKTTVIKDFINRISIELCNELDRRFLIKFDDFTLSTGVEEYNLPADCAEIIGFYDADILGKSQEPSEYMARIFLDDQVIESDTFFKFMVTHFNNPSLITLNSATGVTIKSDSASDTLNVTIIGADKIFATFTETITLNGTTAIAIHLTNGVTKIKEISISGQTFGTLSVTNADTGIMITTMAAGVNFKDYGLYQRKVKITEIPTGTTLIKIAYYKKTKRLVHDFEYPILPEYMHDLIVSGTLFKYYKYVNNIQLSNFWKQEYEIGKLKAKDRETLLHTGRNLQMVMLS